MGQGQAKPIVALNQKTIPKPMRLAWLSVNASYSHSCLALPCLHAASGLRTDAQWREVAATLQDSPWRVVQQLLATAPDWVAGTVYLFNRSMLLSILQRFAVLRPDCPILLGGPEFLGDNREFLTAHPFVAAVVRGEGEHAFAEFAALRGYPEQWGRVKGLCWLDHEGVYRDNAMAIVPDPLDSLPSALHSGFFRIDKPFAALETSRGCPGRCTFCTSCRFGAPRYFSTERVSRDLAELAAAGVTELRVLDRTFNVPSARCVRLLRLLADEPFERIHLEINPGLLTAEVLVALRAFPAGRLHVEAGVQTGSAESAQAVGRSASVERSWAGVKALCGIPGVEVHADLIAGLPLQTRTSVHADLARLADLGPEEIQLELLKLLPGTPLRNKAAEFGLVYNPQPPYEVLRTPQLPFEDLNSIRRLSRAVDMFYNDPCLRQASRIAARQDGRFWTWAPALGAGEDEEPVPLGRTRRFRLLHERAAHLPEVRARLEYAWMREGMGARNGPVEAQLWKEHVPLGAECVEGQADAMDKPCRIWSCRIAGRRHWFVYTRERQQKRAVAVFAAQALADAINSDAS